jgi:hypothetical protein
MEETPLPAEPHQPSEAEALLDTEAPVEEERHGIESTQMPAESEETAAVEGSVIGYGRESSAPPVLKGLMNIGAGPEKKRFSKKEFKECGLPEWVKDVIHKKDKDFKNSDKTDYRTFGINQNATVITERFLSKHQPATLLPERLQILSLPADMRDAHTERLWVDETMPCPHCTWKRAQGPGTICFYFVTLSEIVILPPAPVVEHEVVGGPSPVVESE